MNMKSIFRTFSILTLLALLPLFANAQNALYIPTVTLDAGTNQKINVNLKNIDPITAVQFDISLPEDVTVSTTVNDDDEAVPYILLTSRKKSGHSLNCLRQADGSYRVVIISMSNQTFRDSDGPLVEIGVSTSVLAPVGNYKIYLRNIHLIPQYDGATGERIDQPDYTFDFKIINENGDPSTPDNPNNPETPDNPDQPGTPDNPTISDGKNYFSLKNLELKQGGTALLGIDLTNEDDICSFQFNISLPDGVSVVKEINDDDEYAEAISLSDRKKSSHQLTFKNTGFNSYFIFGYSLQNAAFKGNSGEILTLKLQADEDLAEGTYDVTLSNMLMVTPDERKFEANDLHGYINVTESNGIDNISGKSIAMSKVGDKIFFSGLKKGDILNVYNPAGLLLGKIQSDSESTSINCSDFNSNVLIITISRKESLIEYFKVNI